VRTAGTISQHRPTFPTQECKKLLLEFNQEAVYYFKDGDAHEELRNAAQWVMGRINIC